MDIQGGVLWIYLLCGCPLTPGLQILQDDMGPTHSTMHSSLLFGGTHTQNNTTHGNAFPWVYSYVIRGILHQMTQSGNYTKDPFPFYK